MPSISKRIALAAGAQNDNALSGSPFEFLPFDAVVEVGLAADVNLVVATVTSGSDILQEEGPVTKKAADTTPVYPDDFALQDVAKAGDRLAIKIKNGNAAAAVIFVTVRITGLN
jgi:hypothetical protein